MNEGDSGDTSLPRPNGDIGKDCSFIAVLYPSHTHERSRPGKPTKNTHACVCSHPFWPFSPSTCVVIPFGRFHPARWVAIHSCVPAILDA
eukprot:193944-Pyramimonas_sp.AAC.3